MDFPYPIKGYGSEEFVVSCGAVLFNVAEQVCLLHDEQMDGWILPKGRRNCNETDQDAAIREVREETGYSCKLLRVKMATRAPSNLETADVDDIPRTYDGLKEPFAMEIRHQGDAKSNGDGGRIKLVWWFIAFAVDEYRPGKAEVRYESHFFDCPIAITKLTYQKDRDVLQRAVDLLQGIQWPSNRLVDLWRRAKAAFSRPLRHASP